jgi:hypothetical protein
MPDFNQDVWGKFIAGVQAAMGAGPTGTQLQVFGAPVTYDWGVATGNTAPLEYWNFCDQIIKWSDVGGYSPGSADFVNGYQSWLNNIKQDFSQALKNQITAQSQTIAADVSKANSVLTTVGAAYKQYTINQAQFGMPVAAFTDWANSTGANLQISAAQAQVQKDNDIYTRLLAQENRAYAGAWDAFNNTTFQRLYTDASSNVVTKRLIEWSTNPTDMTQQLRAGLLANSKTISFSNSSSSYDFSKSWASGSASVNYGFWSVGGGGAWTKMNTAEAAASYSATITFKNLSLVTITPDSGWFDSGFLSASANGPYADPQFVGYGKDATAGQTYYFDGPQAVLPGRVTGILVGYQPSFSITTSASAFSEAFEEVQASGGLSIGPFHFGGSGGHTSDIKKSTSSANTIEGADTSNVASVFGIYVSTLP